MALFEIRLIVRDKWCDERDPGGESLALTLDELREQVKSNDIDFAGLDVLYESVMEIESEREEALLENIRLGLTPLKE